MARFELLARSYDSIAELLERLGRELDLRGERTNVTEWLGNARFRGEVSGVDVVIGFEADARVLVEARSPGAPELVLQRETRGWFTRTKDLETGDRAFDDRYYIEGTEGRALGSQWLRGQIDRAFRHFGVELLEVGGDVARMSAPAASLGSPARLRELVELLAGVARSFSRIEIDVRALAARRPALAVGGKARCAFCHESLTGAEPDLVACRSCRTVTHGACWNEHGGCPVFACGGVYADR